MPILKDWSQLLVLAGLLLGMFYQLNTRLGRIEDRLIDLTGRMAFIEGQLSADAPTARTPKHPAPAI